MGERVCIMMYEGGCAFVQTLNVTDALWVDGERRWRWTYLFKKLGSERAK